MKSRLETMVDEFRELRPHFEAATLALRMLVESIVSDSGIDVLEITHRTKEPTSLDGKLRTARHEGVNQLPEIYDLAGVCVVVYFEDDIDRIANALTNSFVGQSESDNVNKMSLVEPDRFGYRARHLTLNISQNLQIPEDSAELLEGYKAEIQIRTAFVNAWAKIEHKYNYKARIGSPEVKRSFAKLASLVELADKELCDIHRWFTENEETIISPASLNTAVSSGENQAVLSILKKQGRTVDLLGSSPLELEQTQSLLQAAGFSSISIVRRRLLEEQHQIVVAMSGFFDKHESEIRPHNAMQFLAFLELRRQRGISGLVEAVEVVAAFEDQMDLLSYCNDVNSSFGAFS